MSPTLQADSLPAEPQGKLNVKWTYIVKKYICCKVGLVVLNSLKFCLSVKLLISPSILSEILVRSSNLDCRFFSFQYFKCMVSFPAGLHSFH